MTGSEPTAVALPAATALLGQVVDAVRDTGGFLLERYSTDARPANREEMFALGRRNEEAASDRLRAALTAARPEAQWLADDQETIALPPGEWWVVDALEGNVNHRHGLPEWGVSATLLHDNLPLLTAFYQPVGDLLYTAIRGGGAYLNGKRLRVSAKTALADAIVATGQAEAEQEATYRRIGDSITTMLGQALLVRASVPSTFPLLFVASGQFDLFWQYEPVLPGVAAGALLVTEAGGIVSDLQGQPWRPGSPDFLAAAPGLHNAAVAALSTIA